MGFNEVLLGGGLMGIPSSRLYNIYNTNDMGIHCCFAVSQYVPIIRVCNLCTQCPEGQLLIRDRFLQALATMRDHAIYKEWDLGYIPTWIVARGVRMLWLADCWPQRCSMASNPEWPCLLSYNRFPNHLANKFALWSKALEDCNARRWKGDSGA